MPAFSSLALAVSGLAADIDALAQKILLVAATLKMTPTTFMDRHLRPRLAKQARRANGRQSKGAPPLEVGGEWQKLSTLGRFELELFLSIAHRFNPKGRNLALGIVIDDGAANEGVQLDAGGRAARIKKLRDLLRKPPKAVHGNIVAIRAKVAAMTEEQLLAVFTETARRYRRKT